MFCKYCGNEHVEDALYCSHCGASLKEKESNEKKPQNVGVYLLMLVKH